MSGANPPESARFAPRSATSSASVGGRLRSCSGTDCGWWAARSSPERADDLLLATQPFRTDARASDILATPAPPLPPLASSGDRLTMNWVMNPPTEFSGGMGTLMSVIRQLEARGHTCRIYVLYKGTRRSIDRDRAATRERFPTLRAEIEDVDAGMQDADAVVATGWPTAYVVRAAATRGARFYLVQDYEPWFYPAGSNATLAGETYRFGFHGITAGRWLSQKLSQDFGMACDHFELGVDLDCYRYDRDVPRSGVVFYSRPGTPRRGFELGMMALDLFARSHPDVEIHLVGQPTQWRRPRFRFVDHGFLEPTELAALYQRCSAGLVLSLTNLSLLPAELLACGCVPVMNDAEHTRASLDSPHVCYAGTMPDQLAAALGRVVDAPPGPDGRAAAAASVRSQSWDRVGDQLEAGFQRGVALVRRA